MSDEEINEQAQLPKYIDKEIYFKTPSREFSYTISNSYKGILRLSPNSTASLAENLDVQISDYNDKSPTSFISYRDSLNEIFGDEDESGTDNNQLVRVSTSDGYYVGLRLDMMSVETDNLYVNGIIKADTAILFPPAAKNDSFMLGNNTAMPIYVNKTDNIDFSEDILTEIKDKNLHYDPFDRIEDVTFEAEVGEETDNSSILYAQDVDGKRQFAYKRVDEIIQDLIQEALMSLHTTPTGSVHFVPVSIEQYIKLLNRNTPNENDSDPIVRDYLLCDGRKYYVKDFPELAKLLANEKISFERQSYYNTESEDRVWRRFEHTNDFNQESQVGEESYTAWFRVPDLRHQFIKAPYMDYQLISDTNETGHWTPDNLPMAKQDNYNDDNHFHFSALPRYNEYNTGRFFDENSCQAMVLNGKCFTDDDDIFTWHVANGRCADGRENHNATNHFITTTRSNSFVGGNSPSAPYKGQQPNLGLSGKSIIDTSKPTTKDDLKKACYNIYKSCLDDYNVDDMLGGNRYGMENNPEFFACVPLIKI